MYCLAIGDALIPAKYFDEYLKEDPIFTGYSSYSFLEDVPRNKIRNLIRKMETEYYNYYEVPEEVCDRIKDVEVLFIHIFPVPSSLIEAAPKLKYILTARGGVENIDVEAAKKRSVSIINCPTHNAIAVAEYTVGLILTEMRNIVRANFALVNGSWREHFPNSALIPEMCTSTIGIVGFGTIGRLTAERIAAFGSEILVNDPYVDQAEIEASGYRSVSLDELLEKSDVVTLHGRISADMPPLIGRDELQRMKKTAYLINTARAVLVDTDALADALINGDIMGAAIDVFPVEPIPEDFPLCRLDNITITNHRGGDTINSYIRAPEILLSQFKGII